MRPLYEIDNEIMGFELEIDEETGEILNYDALDNLKLEREQKLESVGLWYKNLLAEKEMVKAEKNNFAEREKKLDKQIDGIKGYLEHALALDKFSTARVTMSFRKSKIVEIAEDAKLPDVYVKFETIKKPDKKMLKTALEGGEVIKGVRIVEKNNLSIK